MAIRAPRIRRIAGAGRASRSASWNRAVPPHPCAAHELEDRLRRDRLARAGLADDADGLAGGDVERHAADGVNVAVLGRKRHREIGDRQQRADVIDLTSPTSTN